MSAPTVSVIIPMRDEVESIEACIYTFDLQDHPHDCLEVIVVDGLSSDGSRQLVERLAAERSWLHVVDNPERIASAAFNRGLEAAKGDYVAIVSSHGSVGPDFVSTSLRVLDETGAAGVGGRLVHEGHDPRSRAIGEAMTSRFGMASPFRYASTRREVDTIGHPLYRKPVLDEVGGFDQSLDRNSDYELNQRVRNAGHRLMFEPSIVSVYHPRATLPTLARQFWDYGRWKAQIARRDPTNLRWRHVVPPVFVLGVAAVPLASRSATGRRLVGAAGLAYAGILAAAVRAAEPDRARADLTTFVAAFPVMHLTWGAGFLRGLLEPAS